MARACMLAGVVVALQTGTACRAQPPVVLTPRDIVDRLVEASRNQEWGALAEIVDQGSADKLPADPAPEDLAMLVQLGLLLAPGPRSKITIGAAKIDGDQAEVQAHHDLDMHVEVVLVKRGQEWKVDLSQSGPFDISLPQRPGEVVEQLTATVSRRPLPLTLPFWTTETRETLDLDKPEDHESSTVLLRLFPVLWGAKDMKVEIGEPKIQGDRCTVSLRKQISVDQRVALAKEDGVWRVDLLRTVALSLGKEGAAVSPHRERARQSACMANLKQVTLALLMYAQDWKETLPPAETWVQALTPYLRNQAIFRCPADPDRPIGYGFRSALSKVKLANVADLGQTPVFFESTAGGVNPHDEGQSLPPEGRHMGGVVVAYLDGHVKWHTAAEARELLAKPPVLKPGPAVKPTEIPPNAFHAYVAAADILKANGGTGTAAQEGASAEERLALLEKNRGALQLLREGFQRPYNPRPIDGFDQPLPELAGFRDLTRLLVVETRELSEANEWGRAAEAAVDGFRFAHDIPRGGAAIHRLVAIAMEAMSVQALAPIIPHLSAVEAKAAASRLAELDRSEVSLVETFESERTGCRRTLQKMVEQPQMAKDLGKEFGGLPANLGETTKALEAYYVLLLDEARKPLYRRGKLEEPTKNRFLALLIPSLDRVQGKHAEAQALRRMALVALALQAYKAEKAAYPDQLSALAPSVLPAVPADPCHDGPLFYRRDRDGYVLYSAGADLDDDGGKPLPRNHQPRADGDLVWGTVAQTPKQPA